MSKNETAIFRNDPPTTTRLFLPSLLIANFVIAIPTLLVGLLLIDIGKSFGYSVAVSGQIQTMASIVGAIGVILVGAWGMKFRHKSLLLLGLLTCTISALGSAMAWNFSMIALFFSISGLGSAIVSSMSYTLVGKHFPIVKRSRAISWLIAGGGLAWVMSPLIIGSIADVGGWRWAFLGFMFPVSLLSFSIAAKSVPASTKLQNSHPIQSSKTTLEGFKQIFTDSSATACLVGMMFPVAGFQAIGVFGASFFRERFRLSTGMVSIIFPILAVFYILGGQVGGRLVNKVGRKPLSIYSAVTASTCIGSFMIMPNFKLAMGAMVLSGVFNGMLMAASSSLALEQVPNFQGPMMALTSAARSIGGALGAGIGGAALLLWNYEGVSLILGAMVFISALVFSFLVVDPTRI